MAKAVVIKRIFNSPLELVWNAWTNPEIMKKWWGPKIFTCPEAKIDFKVGGKYLYCMRGADGKDYWSTGTYKEIINNKKIVCVDSFADEKGNAVPASHYGMKGDFPFETLVTLTFQERNGKTNMILVHEGLPSEILRDCEMGWRQSFDKLSDVIDEMK